MACTFSINIPGGADSFVAGAKAKVEANSGIFSGDTSSGNFGLSLLGQKISGEYNINGQVVTINISQKPFMISCGTIENYLRTQI